MSKYIKLDDAIERLNQLYHGYEVEAWLESLPTIDIVHCKECEYYYNKDPERIPTASIMCSHMHPDDFCSYGERIDNE